MERPSDFSVLGAFLFAHVASYEQLEALLLLYRSGEGRTPAQVAAALKLEARDAEQILEHLAKSKLLEIDASGAGRAFRYSPGTPELSRNVQSLADAYEDERVKLIELMTANAIYRMRTNALRTFADGFRWGGPKKDG